MKTGQIKSVLIENSSRISTVIWHGPR